MKCCRTGIIGRLVFSCLIWIVDGCLRPETLSSAITISPSNQSKHDHNIQCLVHSILLRSWESISQIRKRVSDSNNMLRKVRNSIFLWKTKWRCFVYIRVISGMRSTSVAINSSIHLLRYSMCVCWFSSLPGTCRRQSRSMYITSL